MNKLMLIAIGLVIIGGGYFLLKGGYQTPSPTVTPIATPEKQTEQAKEITVIASEFSFNPSSISVKADEKIKITLKNNGRAPHDLVIGDLGIRTKVVSPGKTEVIELTAPSSGTYSFFCSLPGHKAAGMEGGLKVE